MIDMVLLKSNDGLPTYHMAHLVDDYLMGTTHVIRSDEWFPSLPFHRQLFTAFGVTIPAYGHVSPLLKVDPTT
jgi:glutamyl-tRNA synthetase